MLTQGLRVQTLQSCIDSGFVSTNPETRAVAHLDERKQPRFQPHCPSELPLGDRVKSIACREAGAARALEVVWRPRNDGQVAFGACKGGAELCRVALEDREIEAKHEIGGPTEREWIRGESIET
jgi:hypothetical protein